MSIEYNEDGSVICRWCSQEPCKCGLPKNEIAMIRQEFLIKISSLEKRLLKEEEKNDHLRKENDSLRDTIGKMSLKLLDILEHHLGERT